MKTEALKAVQKSNNTSFAYMLLDRMRCDLFAFINTMTGRCGNCFENTLWAGNVEDHVAGMIQIHNFLPVKPQWLKISKLHRLASKAIKLKYSS